ncbi:phage/plasmid primase, P4 family [Azoarcus sp. KH32C]|uniref:DNA primase family protein n=1 Tax=Azoarcus sp. KH32C TaxID=748247 RepID=UPI00023866F6|nr:phage/plasmid primase, P4 family [Azoarcus sp. KH32C]BAL23696.1 hypothetical protein AZKH_1374 [Azoarcus sp. KH32C]
MSTRFDPHRYALQLDDGMHASDKQLLYRWTGTHWACVPDEDGERYAYRWIVEHDRGNASPENAKKAHKAAILWMGALPESPTETVIPCRNGYVIARGGRVYTIPPTSSMGLRHVISCDYHPGVADAPNFRRFLDRVLPDPEVQARVQEYIGYTLTSDARHQRAQFWIGGGANGKGVLANIVQALHGKPETVQLDALDGFRLSVLIGASLIYCDEAPRGRINEQLLKSMIAGERVQVDRKYRDPISIHLRGKWLVLGNHLPTVVDHSTGFWRRWDIVPFSVTIPEHERDPLLVRKICEREMSGVLHWALEGLVRLEQRGAFESQLPSAMRAVLHEAKAATNSVQAWADECAITFTASPHTEKDDVYRHYRHWCDRNGVSHMASPAFWTRVRDIGPFLETRKRVALGQVRTCNVVVPSLVTVLTQSIRAA